MSRILKYVTVVAWVSVLMIGAPTRAQGVRDGALFAPADTGGFGGGARANEGLFMDVEWLYWGIQRPPLTTVGDPTISPQTVAVPSGPLPAGGAPLFFQESNTLNTGFIDGWTPTGGIRAEIGNVTDHHGWLLGGFEVQTQEQTLLSRDAYILFKDPQNLLEGLVDSAGVFGLQKLPTIFNYVKVQNDTTPWGLELMYVYRTHPGYHGCMMEFYAGARYLEFDDTFKVWAQDAPPAPPNVSSSGGGSGSLEPVPITSQLLYPGQPTTGGNDNTGSAGSQVIGENNGVPVAPVNNPLTPTAPLVTPQTILADSYWFTTVQNHLIGPQVGARIFGDWGRWSLSAESRFFAALNDETYHQTAFLANKANPPGGVGMPLLMEPTFTTSYDQQYDFCPTGEFRINAAVKLSKAISLQAGWTALYMGRIARAANSVNYEVPSMGLNTSIRQDCLMTGLNLGILINR
jgi:hypothetical protein